MHKIILPIITIAILLLALTPTLPPRVYIYNQKYVHIMWQKQNVQANMAEVHKITKSGQFVHLAKVTIYQDMNSIDLPQDTSHDILFYYSDGDTFFINEYINGVLVGTYQCFYMYNLPIIGRY